jgi:hypothetical protein
MKQNILLFFILVLLFTACVSNDADKNAEVLYRKAEQNFHEADFDKARANLDDIKRRYPNAIETRKKAIVLRQNLELKNAQMKLAVVDSALHATNLIYKYIRSKAEVDKDKGVATREELSEVITTRIKRDSLQVKFDLLCGQIRYIHKKQKEN